MGQIGGCSKYQDQKTLVIRSSCHVISFLSARLTKYNFINHVIYSASGCPGSHIVIRCHDQNLNEDVVMDAAALAARQSKCNGGVIKVSMTRARDVKKPPGAKAGLVQLTGNVTTISVNMKEAQARLDRLDDTVLIN
jgi:hypothetical protein